MVGGAVLNQSYSTIVLFGDNFSNSSIPRASKVQYLGVKTITLLVKLNLTMFEGNSYDG